VLRRRGQLHKAAVPEASAERDRAGPIRTLEVRLERQGFAGEVLERSVGDVPARPRHEGEARRLEDVGDRRRLGLAGALHTIVYGQDTRADAGEERTGILAEEHGDLVPHERAGEAARLPHLRDVALVPTPDVLRLKREEHPVPLAVQPDTLDKQPVPEIAIALVPSAVPFDVAPANAEIDRSRPRPLAHGGGLRLLNGVDRRRGLPGRLSTGDRGGCLSDCHHGRERNRQEREQACDAHDCP
jgi:hypothetical protein